MARNDIKAGRAYVELMLKKKGFAAGLKAAGQRLASFAKVAIAAGAATGAAAVAGAGVAIRHYVQLGSELNRVAQRVGVSVSALSELEHAARQTGTPIDNLHEGLTEMVQRLGEAAVTGSGSAAEQLDRLGLSAKELMTVAPEDALGRISDAINALPTNSEQIFAIDEIFGGDGREMIALLQQGSAGLGSLRDEARELGLTMSGEAAAGAARLAGAFSTVKQQLSVMLYEVGAAVAPFMEVALPVIQRFGKMTIDTIRMASDFVANNMGAIVATVSDAWSSLFNFVAPIAGALTVAITDAFKAIWEMTSSVWGAFDAIIGSTWQSVTGNTTTALGMLQSGLTKYYGTLSFVFRNWQRLAEMAGTSAALSVVRFGNQVGYVFGTVVPGYLGWFADNWREILTDAANFSGTVASNIFKNFQSLWDGIMAMFSGGEFSFEWTPLTEGFRSAIKEMPQIAAREMGPVESELQSRLNDLADDVVGTWSTHQKEFAARAAKFTAENPFADFKLGGAAGGVAGPDRSGFKLPASNTSAEKTKDQLFSTFSAAALAAQGGGMNYQQRSYSELRELRRDQQEHRDRELALLRQIRDGNKLS